MITITRRELLMSLPALGAVSARLVDSRVGAQAGTTPLRVRSINHFGIAVSDPKRSIDFYQGLFGMPVQSRDGATTMLRVGAGPQFLAIAPAAPGMPPRITHFGLGLGGFDVDRVLMALTQHGLTRSTTIGPMKVTVTTRNGS